MNDADDAATPAARTPSAPTTAQTVPPTAAATESDTITTGQYGLLAFLTLLNVLNFVDRQLLASFANFIMPDLELTNTQFGLLTGFVFIAFYAVAGLFMGALADMVHRPRLVAAGVAMWSLLTAASGAARGFLSLAIPRMFIGIGESVLTPSAMSMLADRFPASRMGLAAGIYYMGVPIGVGVSLLIAGFLGPAIGWRNCFYALGAIGVVMAVGMLFVKEVPRRRTASQPSTDQAKAPRQSFATIARTLARALGQSPALTLTISGGVIVHFLLGAAAFDQLWLVRERGFDRAEIAQMTGWIAVVAGVSGNLFGGLGSDWWCRRTGQGRPMFLFWVLAIFAPIGLLYRVAPPDSIWFWVGMFVAFFQLGAFYGPTFSTVQELVPANVRSTVVGFYILMLNLVGLGIGVSVGGLVIDRMIAAEISQPYTWTLFSFTLVSMAAVPLFFIAGRRFSVDRARLDEQARADAGG